MSCSVLILHRKCFWYIFKSWSCNHTWLKRTTIAILPWDYWRCIWSYILTSLISDGVGNVSSQVFSNLKYQVVIIQYSTVIDTLIPSSAHSQQSFSCNQYIAFQEYFLKVSDQKSRQDLKCSSVQYRNLSPDILILFMSETSLYYCQNAFSIRNVLL